MNGQKGLRYWKSLRTNSSLEEPLNIAPTDWRRITLLYDRLIRIQPSPVVELNRAVAVAKCEGQEQGLRLIDSLLAREELAN
jgi:RNA polymerase sigma-70 factor (ECF subfamily)